MNTMIVPDQTHQGGRVATPGKCEVCNNPTFWKVLTSGRPAYWCGCGNGGPEKRPRRNPFRTLVNRWRKTYNRPGGASVHHQEMNAARHEAARLCASELEALLNQYE